MKEATKKQILKKSDELLTFLDSIKCGVSVRFSDEEVSAILKKEEKGAKENYDNAIKKFLESNNETKGASVKRFIVYWGYPGAGKSVMTPKLIERFAKEEDCLPFNIIDKDEHRSLFPNLFDYLKGEHIDECERFAGVTIEYVRKILDLSLEKGNRSVLSVGSFGAGVEFKDNALKAIDKGYKPCAVYMAVNPDIAYLSNIYRSAMLYDKIIFKNQQLYPRLVSNEYFTRVVEQLPKMINRIDEFQKENAENVDLLVVNRANELIYDSRGPHDINVLNVIKNEEEGNWLRTDDIITVNMQLHKIYDSMKYRYEKGIYVPAQSEVDVAKVAVFNIRELIKKQKDGNSMVLNRVWENMASGFGM